MHLINHNFFLKKKFLRLKICISVYLHYHLCKIYTPTQIKIYEYVILVRPEKKTCRLHLETKIFDKQI